MHHRSAILGHLSRYPTRTICSPLPPTQSRSRLFALALVTSRYRPMSTNTTTTPTRHRFLVFAPDKTEGGTFEKRMSVRPVHIEGAKSNFANGLVRVGGAVLTPESIESPDAPKKMVGSAFICEAENINQVWDWLKSDIYYTAGVWDPEKITVQPFVIATPFNI